jgi:hypothetical protein
MVMFAAYIMLATVDIQVGHRLVELVATGDWERPRSIS